MSTGQLVSEEIQDGPSGCDPGSVSSLLYFCSGHDDQDLLPVREDEEGQRAALPAAVAVGHAVSVRHSRGRGELQRPHLTEPVRGLYRQLVSMSNISQILHML